MLTHCMHSTWRDMIGLPGVADFPGVRLGILQVVDIQMCFAAVVQKNLQSWIDLDTQSGVLDASLLHNVQMQTTRYCIRNTFKAEVGSDDAKCAHVK